MKKLLGLLGTILVSSNATGSLLVNKTISNKIKNNLKILIRSKRQAPPSANNEKQLASQAQAEINEDNQEVDVKFIEKELTLNKNYSENIKSMLKQLFDKNFIDPRRSINMGGLTSNEDNNNLITNIFSKLESKMAKWAKDQQNNKEKVLILNLKNKDNNKEIKLVIKLSNFYLLGFINKNQYFYFDDELVKREKKENKDKIYELKELREYLKEFNDLIFNDLIIKKETTHNSEKESKIDQVNELEKLKNELENLKEKLESKIKEKITKLEEQLANENNSEEERKSIENNIKDIAEWKDKTKELEKLKKEKPKDLKELKQQLEIEEDPKAIERLNSEIQDKEEELKEKLKSKIKEKNTKLEEQLANKNNSEEERNNIKNDIKNINKWIEKEIAKENELEIKEKEKAIKNIKNEIKNKIAKENELEKLESEIQVKKEELKEKLEWKIKKELNKWIELEKLKEQIKIENDSEEERKKIENDIKNIDQLIKTEIDKAKELTELTKKLNTAKKLKNKEKIAEINKEIEELKKQILIEIPAINYKNNEGYLRTKIKNLQGEGLKAEEKNIKMINGKVVSQQKFNLDYTAAYSEHALKAVEVVDKQTIPRKISISQTTLNNAISNLATINNKNIQNQAIKDDLIRMIFITSEAMRFQCDEKSLEIYAKFKNAKIPELIKNKKHQEKKLEKLNAEIQEKEKELEKLKSKEDPKAKPWLNLEIQVKDKKDELEKIKADIKTKIDQVNKLKKLEKIIKESKNILNDIQEEVFIKDHTINWEDYASQIRGDWKDYSQQLNKFRIEIWEQVIRIKKLNDFIFTKKDSLKEPNLLAKIIKLKNNDLKEAIKKWFDKNPITNKRFCKDEQLKNDFVEQITNFIKIQTNNLEIWNGLSSALLSEQNLIESMQSTIQNKNIINDRKKTNKEVKKEITNIIDNINKSDDTTLLSLFIIQNNLDMVRLLLLPSILDPDSKAKVINNYWANWSPLHFSSFIGSVKILQELLKTKDIDINILINNEKGPCRPLDLAIMNNNIGIVQELLTNENSKDQISVEAINNDALSPLHFSAYLGYIGIVKLLLANKADPNAKTKNGLTPLNVAEEYQGESSDIVKLLNEFNRLKRKIILCNEWLEKVSLEKVPNEYELGQIIKSLNNAIIEKEILLQIQLSDFITQIDLGEILGEIAAADQEQTILNRVAKLNPQLDINQVKIQENSISETTAIIEAINENYYPGKVQVTFTINQYDVPSDGSCLFWSVATAYLLQVRNNDTEFKNRFIKLFGEGEEELEHLSTIQNLLQQFLTSSNSRRAWYEHTTVNRLVTNVFRNRVVDYIQHHLDTTYNNGLTLRIIIENVDYTNYLQGMRETSAWGGTPEIVAMTNILNTNIRVDDAPYSPINQNVNNTNENIQIFHVESEKRSGIKNHYRFALSQNLTNIISQNNLGEIADNSKQTILNRVKELNRQLDIEKINVTNITNTNALIISNDENIYSGQIIINFIIANETSTENNSQNSSDNNEKDSSTESSGNNGDHNNTNSKNFVGDRGTNGTQQQLSNQKQQANQYDVPSDESCLFWSIATAYLLPVRNNKRQFRERFIQLFGEKPLNDLLIIQKLLRQFDLTNHGHVQNWYQNTHARKLVTHIFRKRVFKYMSSNLHNPIQRNLDGNQAKTFEAVINKIIIDENLVDIHNANDYLTSMANPNAWGGKIEILAITNMLNVNINESNHNIVTTNNGNENIQIFHVESVVGSGIKNHYNFGLPQQSINSNATNISVNNKLKQDKTFTNTTLKPSSKIKAIKKPVDDHGQYHNISLINKDNYDNGSASTIIKAINKYNSLAKEEKQQKLNEINSHYQNLSENDKQIFSDKMKTIGTALIGGGISAIGTIKAISSSASTAISTIGEPMEMTPLLTENVVAEGLTVAETLSLTEAGTAVALAPETLGLSLVIGGLIIAGTAIIWSNSDHTTNTKYESHNQYNEIEKYYKFLAHDQLKLNISSAKWNNIKQIYQSNVSNYQEFKNKVNLEITNFDKEDHSGWGGEITDDDINTLIKTLFNNFQEINNHFSSNSNHGWKIVTNTISDYFMIEEE